MDEIIYNTEKENAIAASWLLHYTQRKRNYIESMQEIETYGSTTSYDVCGHSGAGNPTENKALSINERRRRLAGDKSWLEVVSLVEKSLSKNKMAFLSFRREAAYKNRSRPGKMAWVGYVINRYSDWTYKVYGDEECPSERTMRQWWDDIVDVTVRIAIRRGCL